MQRDVKIGIAIGVLLIALIFVFWYLRNSRHNMPPTEQETKTTETGLPPPVEPVSPPMGVPGEVSPMVSATAPAPMTTGSMPMPMGAATGPATTAIPPPPATASQTYKVQAGDSLAKISGQFYHTQAKWKIIYDANKDKIGANPRNLKVGMELVIPDVAATTPASPATATTAGGTGTAETGGKYVIASGDSLTSIAQKMYGSASQANIDRIYQANKAKIGPDPDDLKVGMELVIPAAQ